MGAKPRLSPGRGGRAWRVAAIAALAVLVIWIVPLFHVHVVELRSPAMNFEASCPGGVSPTVTTLATIADKFWRERLQPSAAGAPDAAAVLTALRADFPGGLDRYAHKVGLGGLAYLYVSGEGRVVRKDASQILVALGSGEPGQPVVALQTGPVFGNAVRDGTGLLSVNDFPSLDEYNALAAELDRLVETRVLPVLRDRAVVGGRVAFAGCAQAPDDPRDAAAPLALVPVRAEIR